jgi:hypothetical protein
MDANDFIDVSAGENTALGIKFCEFFLLLLSRNERGKCKEPCRDVLLLLYFFNVETM